MAGLTIKLFLVEGTPTGTLTAEIGNWTGKVIVSPRPQLADLAKRPEAKRTGLYCLVGRDPDNPTRDCVYIGETDNLLGRLAEHDRDAKQKLDFWTRTILIGSKDENLTKAHARYLEARLLAKSRAADRARITNDTSPEPTPLPESDVADMEQFLSHLEVMLPALGFAFLQPAPQIGSQAPVASSASPLFRLHSVGIEATAREIDGEFVVLKGSTARKEGTPSWTSREQREELVADRKLVDHATDTTVYVFATDVPFDSPSAAATVVRAGNTNGRKEWKEASTGKSYGDWKELRLKLAGVEPETRSTGS